MYVIVCVWVECVRDSLKNYICNCVGSVRDRIGIVKNLKLSVEDGMQTCTYQVYASLFLCFFLVVCVAVCVIVYNYVVMDYVYAVFYIYRCIMQVNHIQVMFLVMIWLSPILILWIPTCR